MLLQRFEPDVLVQSLNGVASRRLGLRGTDGNVHYFSVHGTTSHTTRADDRMGQLYSVLNRLMAKYKESRKRNLIYSIPRAVSITNRFRLVETPEADVNLGEVRFPTYDGAICVSEKHACEFIALF